jgi:FkbM family methyltransferase
MPWRVMAWVMSDPLAPGSPDQPSLVVALARTGDGLPGVEGFESLVHLARASGVPSLSAQGAGNGGSEVALWVEMTLDRLLASRPGPVVVLGTDDPGIAALGRRDGCLPLLLADPSAPWPVDGGVLQADDPWALAPLLSDRPPALLHLLRISEREIQAAHERRASRFRASVAGGGRLLVFGSGTVGRQVVRSLRRHELKPAALIDNAPARQGSVVDGLTVLPPDAVVADRDVVVVAAGMAAASIETQLEDQGVAHAFNLSEVFFALGAEPERALARQLIADRTDYAWLYCQLEDEPSRTCLEAVIRHRLTLDTAHLARVRVRGEPQWFDRDVIPDDDGHVLVDGGAFDGDTLTAFSARFGGRFVRAYGFEPDPALAARAASRFAADQRVVVVPKGLSDHAGSAFFSVTGATDGTITHPGGMEAAPGSPDELGSRIEVVRLDDEVAEPISFLKLDVEGAELAAMRGAARHIGGSRPTLAIAVYHLASDMRDVPQFIAQHRAGDRLYLRHYTDVSFETVLYAVPGPRT